MLLKLTNALSKRMSKMSNFIRCAYLRLICGDRLQLGKVYLGRRFHYDITSRKCNIKIGDNTQFRSDATLRVREGASLNIGKNVFFNRGLSITCLGSVTIGDDCMFGEGVKLYDHNHRFRDKETAIEKQGFSIGQINIGRNCWIGSNVVILKNVTIGDNVVVSANCLINNDLPSNTIVKNNLPLELVNY